MSRKNILILTKIYPAPDLGKAETAVVHYFVKEWKVMGYNVLVVHNYPLFPEFFYTMIKPFKNKLTSFLGAPVPENCGDYQYEYELDGISVCRIPIKKKIPHGKYNEKVLKEQICKIVTFLKSRNFVPDYIVGHWWNPQLIVLNELKKNFNCKTCLVLHENGTKIKKNYPRNYHKLLNSLDAIGLRSLQLKCEFEKKFGNKYSPFVCSSGIPQEYIVKKCERSYKSVSRFVYVGQMIQRKYPEKIIEALQINGWNENDKVMYVGTGAMEQKLRSMINQARIQEQVKILGRKERDEILKILDDSDCFIMISKNEVFGLVYLEAMARGCIPIASKNEGFDGIIIDGVNGFLCAAGNATELANIIEKLKGLSPEQRKAIGMNAINTAKNYTDKSVAEQYLMNFIAVR